jgi:hypothetical protein
MLNCTGANMTFYDEAANDWQLRAYVEDASHVNTTLNSTTNMTYNIGTHIQLISEPITFGELFSNTTNNPNTNSPPFAVRNCGNTLSDMTIQGANISNGEGDYIAATQFKVGATGNSNMTLSESAQDFSEIGGQTYGVSSIRELSFWVSIPIAQAVSSYNQGTWTFTVSADLGCGWQGQSCCAPTGTCHAGLSCQVGACVP